MDHGKVPLILANHSSLLCLAFSKTSTSLRAVAESVFGVLLGRDVRGSTLLLGGESDSSEPQRFARRQLLLSMDAASRRCPGSGFCFRHWSLPPQITSVRQISCGPEHVLLLTADGRAFGCGCVSHGRLGFPGGPNQRWQDSPREIQLRLEGAREGRYVIKKVAAGSRHSLFLTTTGEAFSCGEGRGGRLGQGLPATRRYRPGRVQLPGLAIDCAAGTMHSAFVVVVASCADGGRGTTASAFTCGIGGDGRLGLGRGATRVFTPRRVAIAASILTASRDTKAEQVDIRAVSISSAQPLDFEGGGHTLFLGVKGDVYGCGSCSNARIGVRMRIAGRLGFTVFSRSCYSHAGWERSVDVFHPLHLPIKEPVVAISAGSNVTALLTMSTTRIATFGMSLRTSHRCRELWARGVPPPQVLQRGLECGRVRCKGDSASLEAMLLSSSSPPDEPQYEDQERQRVVVGSAEAQEGRSRRGQQVVGVGIRNMDETKIGEAKQDARVGSCDVEGLAFGIADDLNEALFAIGKDGRARQILKVPRGRQPL